MNPDLDVMRQQILALRRQATFMDHWHNTMKSPWYKRVLWWLMGFRLLALGTWYKAPWNKGARKYDAD